ncbi:hypothetical protein M0805_000679 [Coniferiporia weirii]|nr:hypothetical protein M0805_000679 [Coniferiporia weirii]
MSNGASYDKAILDDAPEVTRGQRQQFYDADILLNDEDQRHGSGTNGSATLPVGAAAPAGARSNPDLESGRMHSREYTPLPPPAVRKTAWYKTRTGIIAVVVIALVVIAAVVGGAVGGTRHHQSNSSNLAGQSQVSQASSPTSQGAGQGGGATATGNNLSATSSAPSSSSSIPAGAGQGIGQGV